MKNQTQFPTLTDVRQCGVSKKDGDREAERRWREKATTEEKKFFEDLDAKMIRKTWKRETLNEEFLHLEKEVPRLKKEGRRLQLLVNMEGETDEGVDVYGDNWFEYNTCWRRYDEACNRRAEIRATAVEMIERFKKENNIDLLV